MARKKNREYWIGRHQQWLNRQDNRDERAARKLKKEYDRIARELEKEIADYFQRYGRDNVIEFRVMMQELSEEDRELLFRNMDAFAEKYPEYAHLLPVRESIYRLNRLQGLHYSTMLKLLELGAIENRELERHLRETYGYHYKQMMRELGLGHRFVAMNEAILRDTIYSGWINEENFSDRIWNNKEKLLNHLQNRYRDALARGDNYERLIKEVRERFGVSYYDARRLVWTEAAFILNQAHLHAYRNAGVEEYELVAIIDRKTSDICRRMHGKVFRFDELEVGVNFPPFHPYCRTTFIGVLKEENSSYNTNIIEKFKNVYEQWDGNSVKLFASKIIELEKLPLKVQRHKIQAYGQCRLSFEGSKINILTFEINSSDLRSVEYQIKTIFHELFHAKSHGAIHDIGKISFRDWAYIDDVFAEVTSHYIIKSLGISKELTPSYASYLVEALPKLKKLPDFKDCHTIADFGKVVMKYRYLDTPNAEWSSLFHTLENIEFDMIEYSKQYVDYITANKKELVDKLLENMPQYSEYKRNMLGELDAAINNIKKGKSLSGNEKMLFENALIISMNRLGVK